MPHNFRDGIINHHGFCYVSLDIMRGTIPKNEENIVLLVERAKRGDTKAFDAIYARYLTPIYRFVYLRVRGVPDAEDLTQLVFIKAWQAVGTFEERGLPFSSLLYKIAKNAIIDFWKRKKEARLDDQEELLGQLRDERQDVERDLEQKEAGERIIKVVEELSEDQQEIIALKFIQDLSNREIAEITGKSEEAIRALQYRALKELRKRSKEI